MGFSLKAGKEKAANLLKKYDAYQDAVAKRRVVNVERLRVRAEQAKLKSTIRKYESSNIKKSDVRSLAGGSSSGGFNMGSFSGASGYTKPKPLDVPKPKGKTITIKIN